ncbi:hypothetical protein DU505_09880 [Billgrantia montanilacus]|uniref:Uncharacterized protein n=1 Tax=Billgrantia montanilacus TaxID=2282305 RepID=A0A368TXD7_9GAMM|nr:hypothetical protein DU505_09880 [Halomonas montanilacus]
MKESKKSTAPPADQSGMDHQADPGGYEQQRQVTQQALPHHSQTGRHTAYHHQAQQQNHHAHNRPRHR